MDVTERDRLAAALAAFRPDWAPGAGVDRLKSLRSWLTKNAMEWPYRDAVVRMVLCAIDPATVTPERALTDGPWTAILRHLSGNASSDQPITGAARGLDCAVCGVSESMHAGVRIGVIYGPHAFQPEAPTTYSTEGARQAARDLMESIRDAHRTSTTETEETDHVNA